MFDFVVDALNIFCVLKNIVLEHIEKNCNFCI